MKNTMTNKKTVVFMIILFLVFVVALPTVCVFIPYRDPQIDYDGMIIVYNDETYQYEVQGEIKNPSVCKINNLKFTIYYFDNAYNQLGQDEVDIELNLGAGKSTVFSAPVVLPANLTAEDWYGFGDFYYEYTTWYAWMYYSIGLIVWGLSTLFFQKKKFVFNIEKHKIVVLATARKATLVIDGKIFKVLQVKTRVDKPQSCAFKICEKILKVQLEFGAYFPNIKITVDGQIPEFSENKQHSFLSIKNDVKKEVKPQ